MIQFFQTGMGKRFYESTAPELALQMRRVADALERILDAVEREHERAAPTEARAPEPVQSSEKEGS